MTPYYLWINRQQPPVLIHQEDTSLSFREWIVFKIRETLNPESDEEDDQYNDDVMQSNERLPPIRLDFRFLPWNDAVRLSCDKKYQVYWKDVDSTELEKPLWSGKENSLQLEWDKEYQFQVLDRTDYVSMLLMVTRDTDYPIRSPSLPSRPSTPVTSFAVGRDTPPPPDRTRKPPVSQPVSQLLHLLQSTFHPSTAHET
jgi:hypothetical protein